MGPKTIHEQAYRILIDCLKEARSEAGLTQVELAQRLSTDQSFVSKYERRERRLDVIELRQVCLALGLSLPNFVKSFERRLPKEFRS